MTRLPTLGDSLQTLGRWGRALDSWAHRQWLDHRRRTLFSLAILDTTNFGRIRGAGALGRLGQLRIGWWDDVITEATRVEASAVVVQVDQIRWLLARVDRSAKS
jgi:hypothetical protein